MSYTYRDRDRDWDEPRSSASVKRYVIPPEDERDLVVRRPADWDDHSGAVSRYGRDMDYDSRHHERGSYEREYSEPYGGYHRYARPEQTPIPIIISNGQPIIIYEARGAVYPRDSDYDFADRDPGYYYHRRVREYDDDRDRHLRREVSPADSISQAGRGRRHRDRDYSSDDSMVYVRRGSREREGREEHPHHQRHMAEGALVGVGAAELIRNRRKNTGDEVSDGVGRVGQDVGAGALGAVAVEAASRARDYYRSRSRPRAHSRSHDDDDRSSRGSHHHRHYSHRRHRRSHGHRSRSRARSHSRTKTLAGLGIGAAAIAAGVALANKNHGKSYDERRSRSRHRRHRSSRRSASEDGEADGHHRGESQRRKHMAGAGLAGAAAAGLIDRARSHSRSHKDGRSRSRSKIRQALPIVAGGLGAAGATGLYEKNKEKKDEERSRHRERRHRSRSLSRTPSDVYPDPTRDSNNLIEYGDRPVHGSIPAADYYGRSPTPPGYFSDATDPVASDAAGYGSSRRRDRSRNRSRSRPGTSSDSSSDSDRGSRRRRRSRHGKSKKVAGAALASAGVGYAAHKYSQHKDRRSPGADRDKLRFEDEVHDDPYESHDPYDDQYNYMPYPPTPPPASRPIENHPPGPGFPPPPGSDPRYAGSHPRPYPPAEYGPPPGSVPPQSHGYPPPPAPEPYPPRSREANANVSTGGNPHLPKAQYTHDGLKEMYSPPETPRVRRRSQPFASRDHRQMDPGYAPYDSDSTIDSANRKHRPTPHRRRRSYPDYKNPDRHYNNARPSEAPDDAPPSDSDSTIDLPDRFDSHGRLLPEKESGSKSRLEDLLGGINNVFA